MTRKAGWRALSGPCARASLQIRTLHNLRNLALTHSAHLHTLLGGCACACGLIYAVGCAVLCGMCGRYRGEVQKSTKECAKLCECRLANVRLKLGK
jgi:hypothetical protein